MFWGWPISTLSVLAFSTATVLDYAKKKIKKKKLAKTSEACCLAKHTQHETQILHNWAL